jgi:hypothetical protein
MEGAPRTPQMEDAPRRAGAYYQHDPHLRHEKHDSTQCSLQTLVYESYESIF